MASSSFSVDINNDFKRLKNLVEENTGWKLAHKLDNVQMWTKKSQISPFNIIKAKTHFKDVSAEVLYDVLHDGVYRPIWDLSMIESKEICKINNASDIGYFAMNLPRPLTNRDFVVQRVWKKDGKEFYILNRSIIHKDVPINKSYIRGVSYLTGYVIRSDHKYVSVPGCTLYYVTQADLKGNLPAIAVNKAMIYLGPRIVEKLHNAALKYTEWKAKNKPDFKPWLYPEQSTLPLVNLKDILKEDSDSHNANSGFGQIEERKVGISS